MGQEVSERSEAGRLLQSHSAFEKGQDERGSSAVRAPPWQSTSRSSLPSATGKFKRNRARAEVRVLTKPQPQRTPSQAAGARRSAGPKGAQSLLPLPLTELSEFLKITPLWCCSPCSSPSPGTPGIRETQLGGGHAPGHTRHSFLKGRDKTAAEQQPGILMVKTMRCKDPNISFLHGSAAQHHPRTSILPWRRGAPSTPGAAPDAGPPGGAACNVASQGSPQSQLSPRQPVGMHRH